MTRAARLGLLLGGSLGLGCRAAPIPAAQRFPAGTPLTARYVTVLGTRIRYIDTGTGPAVILVHGLAASMYSWRKQITPLADAGYRVIAFDNRGFGFSDKPPSGYSNQDYVALLLALMDSLSITDAVLVGHSMGGAIAAEAALAHPERVRGLVLVDAAGLTVRFPFMLRAARWPVVSWVVDRLRGRSATGRILRATYADARRVTTGDIDQYYAPVAEPDFPRALRGVFREFRFDALEGRLSQVSPPTLVVWGAADRVIPFVVGQEMVAALPRGALVRLRDAGHAAPEEQPAEFNRTLLAFLKSGLPLTPPDLARRGGMS
jgi:pimeloyl-ACP methyl ester carboxylesterase